MNLVYDIWTEELYIEYIKYIASFADKEYREFQFTLMPNAKRILGVRLPVLKKAAIEILKGNWRSFLELCTTTYYEEILVKGMVIGKSDITFMEYTHLIDNYTMLINNWTISDVFCTSLSGIANYPMEFWIYIEALLKSKNPWKIRVGIVTMLNYYLDESYVNSVLARINSIHHHHYYVKTAIAWLISESYIKYPGVTYGYLTNTNIDKWTYRRAIEKILESIQVSDEQKLMLQQLIQK